MAALCAVLRIVKALRRVQRACLRSVLRQAHPLHLYCYRLPDGVPDGIDLRDAAEVLPENTIVGHKSGSASLFSNRFRYELQRNGLRTWLDCDPYLLKPLDGESPICSAPSIPTGSTAACCGCRRSRCSRLC